MALERALQQRQRHIVGSGVHVDADEHVVRGRKNILVAGGTGAGKPSQAMVEVVIEDDGIGFDQRYAEQIRFVCRGSNKYKA